MKVTVSTTPTESVYTRNTTTGRPAPIEGKYTPQDYTPQEFLELVKNTIHSPIVFKDGKRKGDNFKSAHCIILDYDDGLSIDEFKANTEISKYTYILYTSRGHYLSKDEKHPECERFHVLFPLERPITAPEQYKETVKSLMTLCDKQFPNNKCDGAVKDVARFFYPSRQSGEPVLDTFTTHINQDGSYIKPETLIKLSVVPEPKPKPEPKPLPITPPPTTAGIPDLSTDTCTKASKDIYNYFRDNTEINTWFKQFKTIYKGMCEMYQNDTDKAYSNAVKLNWHVYKQHDDTETWDDNVTWCEQQTGIYNDTANSITSASWGAVLSAIKKNRKDTSVSMPAVSDNIEKTEDVARVYSQLVKIEAIEAIKAKYWNNPQVLKHVKEPHFKNKVYVHNYSKGVGMFTQFFAYIQPAKHTEIADIPTYTELLKDVVGKGTKKHLKRITALEREPLTPLHTAGIFTDHNFSNPQPFWNGEHYKRWGSYLLVQNPLYTPVTAPEDKADIIENAIQARFKELATTYKQLLATFCFEVRTKSRVTMLFVGERNTGKDFFGGKILNGFYELPVSTPVDFGRFSNSTMMKHNLYSDATTKDNISKDLGERGVFAFAKRNSGNGTITLEEKGKQVDRGGIPNMMWLTITSNDPALLSHPDKITAGADIGFFAVDMKVSLNKLVGYDFQAKIDNNGGLQEFMSHYRNKYLSKVYQDLLLERCKASSEGRSQEYRYGFKVPVTDALKNSHNISMGEKTRERISICIDYIIETETRNSTDNKLLKRGFIDKGSLNQYIKTVSKIEVKTYPTIAVVWKALIKSDIISDQRTSSSIEGKKRNVYKLNFQNLYNCWLETHIGMTLPKCLEKYDTKEV